MPDGFSSLPDWFPWENQGAGVATFDLNGSGRPDLIVLQIDAPAGQNGGFYRVGRDLDADGAVTGGWGDWIAVPDWFSVENQGAGIALADLDNDGRPDVIVFQIDSPPGKNQGYYRVGRKLDADGQVTGGWGDWAPIPDWFPWENQEGGIAVADLTGNGRPDLVVLMVDAPPEQNQGFVRVGRDLAADGSVTGGWSDWAPVPDWFPWENQGAGVAVADLENSGLRDIVVFMVDNPPERNQAFYKIGRNFGSDAHVAGGWGSWLGVPGWASWENQGADIATAPLSGLGKHELVVLGVDAPPGQNAGLWRVLELDSDPATQGQWELLPFDSEVLAIHAAVLSSGKVLFFAGSGNNTVRFGSPDWGDLTKKVWCSVVWDPTLPPDGGGNFFHPETPRNAQGRPVDFFCGGDSFLADGRLLHAGGTLAYLDDGFLGLVDSLTFDPDTQQWMETADMAHGRWYPTLVTLGDGRIVAASGLSEEGGLNRTLEVYSPETDAWRETGVPANFGGLPLYAHLFLLRDGRLFFSGGRMDDPNPVQPCLLDLTHDPVRLTPVPGLDQPTFRNQSASVLLPPAQDQRVLILGGGPNDETDATDSVNVVDLTAPAPAYHAAAPMSLPRMHLNAVLMPDRTVFVSGGALAREFKIAARLQGEIYDPATDSWRIAATAAIPRMYHSIALLLPDGRVVAAGGNPERGTQVAWEPPDPNEEMRLEVYSPPYLFRGPRPVIAGAPTEWQYGQTVSIQTPQAGAIRWASLIKNGVTTHSFNTSQRLVALEIVSQGGGVLQATVTDEPNLAPEGWYMLFLTDTDGVPSVAHWIHLSP